jgi:DNA-binding LacI/PurR family transcriptional regulator
VIALVLCRREDQGLEIGQELAVTGYGDILLAEYATPSHHDPPPTYALGQSLPN